MDPSDMDSSDMDSSDMDSSDMDSSDMASAETNTVEMNTIEMSTVDIRGTAPPQDWGVVVDTDAVDALAQRWVNDRFTLPQFDYPGTPSVRDERWWFDYVTLAVSVLACLWPPEEETMWQTDLDGVWLDDAPGIFAAFTRLVGQDGLKLTDFAELSDADGQRLFHGRGTLQLIPERTNRLRAVAQALIGHWNGTALNLVDAAERDGSRIVELLVETVPGYRDRPSSPRGQLQFDKLAHLATAIMASGVGWEAAGFHGFHDFPVYPDYMLPRVFRHFGAMQYSPSVAAAVDGRQVIEADSAAEHAIRWATVYCGHALQSALAEHGNRVSAPALDYRLWSEAVLGPDAQSFGEHHRTITLSY